LSSLVVPKTGHWEETATPLNLPGGDSHVTMWSVSSHTARFFYGYRSPVPVDCG